MREGLDAEQARVHAVLRPYSFMLLAEAYAEVGQSEDGLNAVSEELDRANRSGNCFVLGQISVFLARVLDLREMGRFEYGPEGLSPCCEGLSAVLLAQNGFKMASTWRSRTLLSRLDAEIGLNCPCELWRRMSSAQGHSGVSAHLDTLPHPTGL